MVQRNFHTGLKVLAASLLCIGFASLGTAAELKSGVEKQYFDPSVRIQDNIFLAVNGTWIKNTPIPADKGRFGAFDILRDTSETRTRMIIEDAAAKKQAKGSEGEKIGMLYNSFMDEATVERLGIKPLAADLKKIAAIKTTKDIAKVMGEMQTAQINGPLRLDVNQDAKDSTRYQTDVRQGGLGMPDRDYFLKDDPRFKAARDAYVVYLTTLFKLAGEKAPEAAAASVMKLETALAQIQWTKVENRNPEKTYNKKTPTDLAKLTPAVDWST